MHALMNHCQDRFGNYNYIKSPEAFLRVKSDSTEVSDRVVLGENASVRVWTHEGASNRKSCFVQTEKGYCGWLDAEHLTSRNFPYLSDLEVTREKTTLYTKNNNNFHAETIVYRGTRLQSISVIQNGDQTPFWIQVALPDGTKRYIKSNKVQFDKPGFLVLVEQYRTLVKTETRNQ